MKVSAIICEYNPLHNGHIHHIRETRRHGATHIIAVLSSNFVQRGDVALLNKFDRAQLAVQAGADLVLELPVAYSCAAAEDYATGAVTLLHRLGIVDELSFGSSTGDIEVIELLTDASLSTTQVYGERIAERMKAGDSYPAAVWEIVRQRYGNNVAGKMHDPNNLLAIEYMKAIRKTRARFEPFTIPRRYVMHDAAEPQAQYASATYVRKSVCEGDQNYRSYVPAYAARMLAERITEGRIAQLRRLENIILYRMRNITKEEMLRLPDMNEALYHRFYAARNVNSLEELLIQVKTKCYTMSRIRRSILAAVIGLHRGALKTEPPYARVLAFNDRGQELMGIARKKSSIPIHTSLAKLRETDAVCRAFVELEERASNVYGLAAQTVTSCEEDYRARIIKGSRV